MPKVWLFGRVTGQQRNETAKVRREIYKCPSCGEILKSYTANCPACGFELRGRIETVLR